MTSDRAIEIYTFYSRLLQSYTILTEEKIRDSMMHEELKHKTISWQSFGEHIHHLRSALAVSNLSEDRKDAISISLTRQQEEYDKFLWQPEGIKNVGEADREMLIARRWQLTAGCYYTHEKEIWQSLHAQGFLSHWTDAPRNIINEIDRKVQALDNLRRNPSQTTSHSSFRQPPIIRMLMPEQEKKEFNVRWDEFCNVVKISFSSPDDDAEIKVYNAAAPPQEFSGAGLWYPMITNGAACEPCLWLDFSQQKRDAIRSGFIQGICTLANYYVADSLEWRAQRNELYPHFFSQYLNPIMEQAHRTKQYAQARERIEKILKAIYSVGQNIPYHPNFDAALLTHLEQLPTHEVEAFLSDLCEKEHLNNPNGKAYLLNLVGNTLQADEFFSKEKANRALTWLRTAEFQDLPTTDSVTAHKTGLLNNDTDNTINGNLAQLSVADLFRFSEAGRREEVAKKAKVAWDKMRDKMPFPADAPTTAAALFKLMDWLGMVREGASAAKWRAAFQREWDVQVSEGIAKYQIEKPTSDKFKKAVILAFEILKTNYPPWVKGKDLPGIYR